MARSRSKGKLKDRRKRRGMVLTSTWGLARKIGLIAIFVTGLALVITLAAPIGFVVLAGLWAVKSIWKVRDPEADPTLGTIIPNTFEDKVATFFESLKSRWSESIDPVVSIGMGPPEDDMYMEVEQGWKPPFRLSSYWALLCAVPLVALDWAFDFITVPFYGFKPPVYVVMALSFIGWYMVFQVSANAARALGERAHGASYPATLVNKLHLDKSLAGAVLKTIGWSSIVPGIILVLGLTANRFIEVPWVIFGAFLVSVFAAFFSLILSRKLSAIYRVKWAEDNDERQRWDDVFIGLKDKAPIYLGKADLPGLDVWMERQEDEDDFDDYDDEDEDEDSPSGKSSGPNPNDYVPDTWAVTFSIAPSATFDRDYSGLAPALGPTLGDVATGVVCPVPQDDPEGYPINGTESAEYFRIMWTERHLEISDVYRHDLEPELIEIAVRHFVIDPISQIKRIGRVKYHSRSMMTHAMSGPQVARVSFIPSTDASFQEMMGSLNLIVEKIGVKWARIGETTDTMTGRRMYDLFLGDDPTVNPEDVKWNMSAMRKSHDILLSVWNYSLFANKIYGDTGSPRVLDIQPINRPPTAKERKEGKSKGSKVGETLVFDLPVGLDLNTIFKNQDGIMTSSGNEFMEIVPGINKSSSLANASRSELGSKSQFSLITGERHPLRELFKFSDYEPEIISGREEGVAKVDTVAGVLADGTFAVDSYNGAEPMLVIAGSSGSGKSLVSTTRAVVKKKAKT